MKRKTIIIIAVSLALAVCLGVGCFHFFRYGYYSPEAKIVKQLLTGLKTNLGEYGTKGYIVSFRQEYEIESKRNDETADVDLAVSYKAAGSVRLSYNLDKDVNGPVRLTDLISSGNGYLRGLQREQFKCYNKEDRIDDEYDRLDDIEYDLALEFAVKTEGDRLYAASDSVYKDLKDGANSYDDSFSGVIDRQLFLGSVSEERLSKAMTRLLFLDAWEYIEQFGNLSGQYLEMIDFSNAKEVNDFIREKEIVVDDRGEIAHVSFVLDSAGIVSEITEEEADHLPKIYGFIQLDKKTGDVLHFEYYFGQYLLASLMKSGEGIPDYKAAVKDFTVEGRIIQTELEDLPLDRTFTEYTDENKYEFIHAFSEHIIPFYEEEG